jgi:hypothetical protein
MNLTTRKLSDLVLSDLFKYFLEKAGRIIEQERDLSDKLLTLHLAGNSVLLFDLGLILQTLTSNMKNI